MSSPAEDPTKPTPHTDEPDRDGDQPEPSDRWADVSADDRDEGWGERSTGYTDDWYRSERPPHHG